MSERRRGLGRGLGALIPTGPAEDGVDGPRQGVLRSGVGTLEATRRRDARSRGAGGNVSRETSAEPSANGDVAPTEMAPTGAGLVAVAGARFAEIPVEEISPNPRQPRQAFDEDAMAELVHSIKEIGLLQPVVVRAVGDDRYQLVMGERRWRATREAGLATIPAIVRDARDDSMLRDALLENLHRSDLNPLEEAAAYEQLLEEFGCTQDELAARIGRSRPQISNTLRLMKLPPLVQRRVAAGVLSAGHARALLGLTDGGAQERLAQRIVAEGLSVRAVEEIVALGGDEAAKDKKPKPTRPVAPRLDDIATILSERLDTRVKVNLGRSKGKVTIEFASIDDLERIVGTIVPN